PHEEFERLVGSVGAIVAPSPAAAAVQRLPVSPTSRPPRLRPSKPSDASGARSRFDPLAWGLPNEDLLGFVEIPAGAFTMGSDKNIDAQAGDNELPQHQVTLPSFFMGRYE